VPAVILARDEHVAIERLIVDAKNTVLGDRNPRTIDELRDLLEQAYAGCDEYIEAIRGFFP